MDRNKKVQLVEDVKSKLESSAVVIVVQQNSLTVVESESFRSSLRKCQASYFVTKNTLARISVKDTRYECLSASFKGQVGLVFSKDITGAAKVVHELASAKDAKIKVLSGWYNDNLLSVADIKALAILPSLDELRSKVIAVIQTPAQRLAVLTQAPAAQIARVLDAYSKK